MDYLGVLQDLTNRFRLVQVPTSSMSEPKLALEAPPEIRGGAGLGFRETTEAMKVVNGLPVTYDVAYTLRNVRLDPATGDVIGGMPVLVPTGSLPPPLPPPSLMYSVPGSENKPGIPAVVGKFKAVVTPKIEKLVTSATLRPIEIETEWFVFGVNDPASGIEYAFTPEMQWNPLWNGQFGIPTAARLLPPAMLLKLPIRFAPFTDPLPPPAQYSVAARIRLTMTVGTSKIPGTWVRIPEVNLSVPVVPMPVVLVLFDEPYYNGKALVVVPLGSPIVPGGVSLRDALNAAAAALRMLLPNHPFLTFLTTPPGNRLLNLTPQPNRVLFVSANEIRRLSEDQYLIDPGGLAYMGRLTGDNMAESILFIGPPGAVADMFAEENLSEAVTRLQVSLPSGADSPLGIGLGNIARSADEIVVTYGGRLTSARPDAGYDNKISSLAITVR